MASRKRKTLLLSSLVAVIYKRKKRIRETQRKRWCKDWLRNKHLSSYSTIFNELTVHKEDFQNYIRMPFGLFNNLRDKIQPIVGRLDTDMRASISCGARLEATLLFLCSGMNYTRLQYCTRISKQSLSKIVPETCSAIYKVLKDDYLKTPSTTEEWDKVARSFHQKWNFPNVLGAIDGKHIAIIAPQNAGSYYYNYKGFHSIVLLGIADANYEFLYVDVGINGRVSDGGVWRNCSLKKALEAPSNPLKIPNSKSLPNSTKVLPMVLLADDAFPLSTHMMKPFPNRGQSKAQRIFSYRLSRGRRIIENAFGILSSKFRVLHTHIGLSPEKVVQIVLSCCALHNLLRRESPLYLTPNLIDREDETTGRIDLGAWREQHLLSLDHNVGRNPNEAVEIRNTLMDYFNNEGAVPWQENIFN